MPSRAETGIRWKAGTRSSSGSAFPKILLLRVLRPFLVVLITPAILQCFSPLGIHSAWSQVTSDEYIAGFATAVLRHEFKATDSTLQVHNGVVRVNARSLGGLDREKIKRALAGIAGVKEVVLIEDEAIAA